jgi:hypothetical protein
LAKQLGNTRGWEVQVSKSIIYLVDVRAHRQGWSKHELAHFRRAKNLLRDSGISIETDSGLTDEGDPWFAFYETESGEVFAHFAKIDGKNVASAPSHSLLTGRIFPDLVARIVERRPRRVSSPGSHSSPAAWSAIGAWRFERRRRADFRLPWAGDKQALALELTFDSAQDVCSMESAAKPDFR